MVTHTNKPQLINRGVSLALAGNPHIWSGTTPLKVNRGVLSRDSHYELKLDSLQVGLQATLQRNLKHAKAMRDKTRYQNTMALSPKDAFSAQVA